jgi:hypothetical protein
MFDSNGDSGDPNGERRGMFSDRRMSLVVGVATAERCA